MSDEQVFKQIGEYSGGPSAARIVCVADHASNHVPDDIPLGIAGELLDQHIALDIGVEGVAQRLVRRHGIPAHLATISRLVVDLHREEEHPNVVPTVSDGHLIPGNIGADIEGRLSRFHRPYHQGLAEWLDRMAPELILSIHSFTPKLATSSDARPWEIALLYNQDDRAARHAIRLLGEMGFNVGDNEPYSGTELNATMNRHAEAHGRPYCAIEIRQDLIVTPAEQARFATMIADVAGRVALALA
jgi:predicted N-formylglutamate amidohydrolase